MSQHYNPQTSGMLERYGKEVAPLRKANEKNDVVNKVLMVACLVVCTVAGVVAGYFIGYTLASTFIGLLAGAAAALGLCYLVYFLRKRRFLANKQNADGGEKRIAEEYRAHYGMPSQPLETEIVATSDSPLKSQKAVCWADKVSVVRFVAPDYTHDFGCYSFAEGEPLVVIPSFEDSNMVYIKLSDGASVFCRQNCLAVFDFEKSLGKDDLNLFGATISTDGGLQIKEQEKAAPKRTDTPEEVNLSSGLEAAISAIIGKGSSTL